MRYINLRLTYLLTSTPARRCSASEDYLFCALQMHSSSSSSSSSLLLLLQVNVFASLWIEPATGSKHYPNGRHDMRPLLVFALNSTSAQWCADTFSYAAVLSLEHCCHAVISKSTHFRCCIILDKTCTMESGSSWSWFYMNRCMFSGRYAPRRFLHFGHQWPWPLTLWIKIAVPVTLHGVYNLPWKFELCIRCSVFELTAGTALDRVWQTNWGGVTRNAAS